MLFQIWDKESVHINLCSYFFLDKKSM